eukprot:CAMPEP_0203756222 /NCGR_PEP_ID=MMETSP0098-20131031/9533_1 /ASSEMBLY_ACC=CAM_ASM_000208 /TAXON_ID=96639 /ORGANISM=" , Strain NY0313808BC1" /LENGTH=30 /DNA_ID= /DNA_START= /DNA_END= /DNA_ORIENTATION=
MTFEHFGNALKSYQAVLALVCQNWCSDCVL